MIRIGVLGAAKIAPKGIIKPAQNRQDCNLIAVASRNIAKCETYAELHDIPIALQGYDALIERDDIDLIYNALPPHRHMDLSIKALKTGKSVLCEKPFALNAVEAETMVSAANASKGHLIEGFHYRYHPACLKFLDIINSGKIGNSLDIKGVFNVSIPNGEGELRYIPELGGGALMDLGCYVLHLMRLITRRDPMITSAASVTSESGVDVQMTSIIEFGNISATLNCDMREGTERQIKITVTGTKGRLTFDQFVHPYREDGFSIILETEHDIQTVSQEDDHALYRQSTYAYQLSHVIDVMSGRAVAQTGGQDAISTMKAIDAIYAAAR